jgi:hypothetical protein
MDQTYAEVMRNYPPIAERVDIDLEPTTKGLRVDTRQLTAKKAALALIYLG